MQDNKVNNYDFVPFGNINKKNYMIDHQFTAKFAN